MIADKGAASKSRFSLRVTKIFVKGRWRDRPCKNFSLL